MSQGFSCKEFHISTSKWQSREFCQIVRKVVLSRKRVTVRTSINVLITAVESRPMKAVGNKKNSGEYSAKQKE